MGKDQYIRQIIKVGIIMLLVLILFLVLTLVLNRVEQEQEVDIDALDTIREVVEFYGSKYISENLSEEPGYAYDVKVVFKVKPYVEETEEINRQYYETLLDAIARVINYRSYIIRDDEKDITIKVVCIDGKISKIILNDIEDYFTYIESLVSAKHYEEIEETDLEPTSEILTNIISNNWSANTDIGQKSSIYNGYEIYLDMGIRVKKVQDKIFNIVFTDRYQGSVVNNISVEQSLDKVQSILGNPSFSYKDEEKDIEVIGYKSNKIYAFFNNKKEISIYWIEKKNTDDFFKLANKYFEDNYNTQDFLNFMNDLTYLWKDYTDYEYTKNSVFIAYPQRGIEIKVGYDDTNGILVYNNINTELSTLETYFENTVYISRLKIDAIFEAEKRRNEDDYNDKQKSEDYKEKLKENEEYISGFSSAYDFYPKYSMDEIIGMKFISKEENLPNRELNDYVDTYIWISDTKFAYSKNMVGIFLYDLETGYVSRIIDENEDPYVIKGFENGILKYDNSEVAIES